VGGQFGKQVPLIEGTLGGLAFSKKSDDVRKGKKANWIKQVGPFILNSQKKNQKKTI